MDSNPSNSPPNQAPNSSASSAPDSAVRVLKKYPNRRLYDSYSSSYVTLADVKNMVVEGTAFRVVDAKTGENLTRSILLQIILEEETAGSPLFSETMLRVLIRVYGQAMHSSLGTWLEHSLGGVAKMQDALGVQWQVQMDQLSQMPGAVPFTGLPAALPPLPNLPGADWMQQVSSQWQAQQEQLRQTSEQFFASFQPPAVPPVAPEADGTAPAASAATKSRSRKPSP